MYKFLPTIISLTVLGLSVAEPTLAVSLSDPLGGVSVPVIIGRVVKGVLGISGSLALIMFIYGGIIWLTSGGSPERIKKGKNTLIWAVIGMAIIFSAYMAVDLVIRALSSGETT